MAATPRVRSEPGYLGVRFDLPDGRTARAGPDEADAFNVPVKLDFETSVRGGHGPCNIVLPRPDDFDPLDAGLLASTRIFDQAGRNVHEARVVGMPHTGVNYIEVQGEGWAAHLEADETAKALFIDRDLSHWRGATRERILQLISSRNFADPEVVQDKSSALPSLRMPASGAWTTVRPMCEAWYDAGAGLKVGSVYSNWAWSAAVSVSWILGLFANDNDNSIMTPFDTVKADILTAAGASSRAAIDTLATARRYIMWQYVYNANGAGLANFDYSIFGRSICVFGETGLEVRGTAPDFGLYVSDMVSWIVSRYAPLLTIPADGIEATSFVVPHAAYLDDTTARAMIESLLLFGGNSAYPLDYGVYDDRGFYMRSPGNYGKVWRIRRDEGSESLNQGSDAQELINGVKVTYNDGSGAIKSVGPVGSGSDLETDLVTITDPNHPRNRIGERAWKRLDAGVLNNTGATLLAQLYLAAKNTEEWRGDVDITGDQLDSAGNQIPAYMVRSGDRVVLEDDRDTRERRIVSTRYSSDGTTNKLSIGAAPDRVDTLLARAGVVVSDLGVS